MSNWVTTLGMKQYQIVFDVKVGFTVLAHTLDDAKELAETLVFDERENFFIEINGSGVDWIAAGVQEVEEKDV